MAFFHSFYFRLIFILIIFLAFLFFRSSDEENIREQLVDLAKAASIKKDVDKSNVLGQVSQINEVTSFFDHNLTIDLGSVSKKKIKLKEEDELKKVVISLQKNVKFIQFSFDKIEIKINEDKAFVSCVGQAKGEKIDEMRDLKLIFKEIDGDWLISEVAVNLDEAPVTGKIKK